MSVLTARVEDGELKDLADILEQIGLRMLKRSTLEFVEQDERNMAQIVKYLNNRARVVLTGEDSDP